MAIQRTCQNDYEKDHYKREAAFHSYSPLEFLKSFFEKRNKESAILSSILIRNILRTNQKLKKTAKQAQEVYEMGMTINSVDIY